jgi:hypothetical protein
MANAADAELSQKITVLIESLKKAGIVDKDRATAFQVAKLESSNDVLTELLSRLKSSSNINDEYDILTIFVSLGVPANTFLADALKIEENPFVKVSMIHVLGQFKSVTSLKVIVEQLTDKRDAEVPTPLMEGLPDRICDVAYGYAVGQLEEMGLIDKDKFVYIKCGDTTDKKDTLIAAFKEYWKAEGDNLCAKIK